MMGLTESLQYLRKHAEKKVSCLDPSVEIRFVTFVMTRFVTQHVKTCKVYIGSLGVGLEDCPYYTNTVKFRY